MVVQHHSSIIWQKYLEKLQSCVCVCQKSLIPIPPSHIRSSIPWRPPLAEILDPRQNCATIPRLSDCLSVSVAGSKLWSCWSNTLIYHHDHVTEQNTAIQHNNSTVTSARRHNTTTSSSQQNTATPNSQHCSLTAHTNTITDRLLFRSLTPVLCERRCLV